MEGRTRESNQESPAPLPTKAAILQMPAALKGACFLLIHGPTTQIKSGLHQEWGWLKVKRQISHLVRRPCPQWLTSSRFQLFYWHAWVLNGAVSTIAAGNGLADEPQLPEQGLARPKPQMEEQPADVDADRPRTGKFTATGNVDERADEYIQKVHRKMLGEEIVGMCGGSHEVSHILEEGGETEAQFGCK